MGASKNIMASENIKNLPNLWKTNHSEMSGSTMQWNWALLWN